MLAPFWTAYLIRVIAWNPVLGRNGAVNYLADKLGFEPFDFLIYSDFAVNLTLVQLYVLFMVTPVFFQLAAIDNSAVEAAKDLGASPFKVFREVILPLSLPGVMIGFIFVFVLVHGRLRDRPLHQRLDRDVRRQRGQRLLQQRRTCRRPRPVRRSSSSR